MNPDKPMTSTEAAPIAGSTDRLMRLASYASVTTAGLLILVKLFAWHYTNSISLFASLIDSVLDVAASVISMLAIRQALMPPDREHRFGHGKAEPLAALGQAAFICGSGIFLIIQALSRLITPVPPTHGAVGIAVMLFSIVVTLGLVCFQHYVVRRSASIAIAADSLHYKGDLLANTAVIVALVLSTQLGWARADSLFALGIAFYILYNTWIIACDALDMLMDRELPDQERKRIISLIFQQPRVLAIHDLRTRRAGTQIFIQCHIEMNANISLLQAHEIVDRVEILLTEHFPRAEVILHEDPYLEEQDAPSRILRDSQEFAELKSAENNATA